MLATISTMHAILIASRDSPKINIPKIAAPTVPIPVHTA